MWIVFKYKKKEFSLLKQDFRKILGDLPLIFRPKFKYQKLIKKILIGMSSNEVEDAIGLPIIKDTINKGNRIYELWTYNNRPNLSRVYLEENLVIKVE